MFWPSPVFSHLLVKVIKKSLVFVRFAPSIVRDCNIESKFFVRRSNIITNLTVKKIKPIYAISAIQVFRHIFNIHARPVDTVQLRQLHRWWCGLIPLCKRKIGCRGANGARVQERR